MDEEKKDSGFRSILIVAVIAMMIAFFWDSFPIIKNVAHFILDPTAGNLLEWNLANGMIFLVFALSLVMTLAQKYGTDQEALKEMKKEQKEVQKEMKALRDNPEKLMEMQKKHFSEFMPKMMKLSMRPIIYTMIPLILFFRWFADFFSAAGDPRIFGLTWIWFYILGSVIFSLVFKKILKVA